MQRKYRRSTGWYLAKKKENNSLQLYHSTPFKKTLCSQYAALLIWAVSSKCSLIQENKN